MRTFEDDAGNRWRAELISHGTASAYLNPRVQKPILQFSREDHPGAPRYVGYAEDKHGPLMEAPEEVLRGLLAKAKTH
ncbi:MAG: hypothetical protein OEZ54_08125 [Gemmatimonadota bacterium]|nr:hypothetical protein [Gemmatimonadota bacterium]